MNRSKIRIFVILIVCLATFLRFYKISDRFIFTLDEEYQTTLAKTVVDNFHIIWVGVSASAGLYMGPLWTYFTAFWLYLSKNDPLITSYVSAAIGVLTTALVFYVGQKQFGTRVGILASFLYATLPIIIFFDQRYWNPSLVPLLALLMYFSLANIQNSPWWWVLFAICVGLIFNTHLAALPLILIGLYQLIRFGKKLSRKVFLISAVTFVIFVSPLMAFYYFNHSIKFHVNTDETTKINPVHKSKALFSFLGRYLYLNPYGISSDEAEWSCSPTAIYNFQSDPASTQTRPSIIISLLGLVMILVFITRQSTWKDESKKILALCILTILTAFIFYPGMALEYYLLPIFPLLVYIPGLIVPSKKLSKTIFLLIFTLAIPISGVFTIMTSKGDFGVANKRKLIDQVMEKVKDEPFVLLEDGNCHTWQGWRYLFSVYGRRPERSSVDNTLSWLYPDEISTQKSKYNVVVYDTRSNAGVKWSGYTYEVSSGGFTAKIYANRN